MNLLSLEPPTVQSDGSNLVITVPNLSSTNSTLKIAYRELQTLMPVCSDFMSEVYPIANRLPFESTIVNAKCNYSYCVAIIQLEQDGDEKDASNPVTISVPCAGSGGPSLTFPILILVSVGGGALLLLTVMTCLALLCLCCKARRIRRGAKMYGSQCSIDIIDSEHSNLVVEFGFMCSHIMHRTTYTILHSMTSTYTAINTSLSSCIPTVNNLACHKVYSTVYT